MSEIPVLGTRKLKPRLLIVDYDLIGPNGEKIGGGFHRLEASTGDSVIRQMNQVLSGRRFKVTLFTPVT